MLTRIQISAFLTLSVALWIGFLFVRGVPVSFDLLIPFSSVVGAVSIILLIFDVWLWKLPIFRGWLIKRPVLSGTWRTQIQSDWINPETEANIPTINCFVVVRQTASKLSIRLITAESSSETVSAGIEACTDGTFEISCTYRNKPKSIFRDRSQIHYGAMLLHSENMTPKRLEGEYWTDRNSKGYMILSSRVKSTPMTFDEAIALYPAE